MILPHDQATAQGLVESFCSANALAKPLLCFAPAKPHGAANNGYGYYHRTQFFIEVYAAQCKGVSERSWSYPGYTHDLTVMGVTAHELGHHVMNVLGWRETLAKWYSLTMKHLAEAPVGEYAMSRPAEDFAEAMRLFAVNPSLLEAIAPSRHHFMTKILSLKPVEARHWRELLCDSPRHVQRVEEKLTGLDPSSD